jgi:nicotinate-nucleotide adenylyltransferase
METDRCGADEVKTTQRIGLFGGTFDPVHNGHLAVANSAKKSFQLDSLWFIPAATPPHKNTHHDQQIISPFADRVAMLKLALASHDDFFLSQLENELPKPSYTVDTLQEIRQRLGLEVELFFFVGVDAFMEVATWKEYGRLPTLASFVVISRPAYPLTRAEKVITTCYKDYWYDPMSGVWETRGTGEKIYFMSMKPVPHSSSDIRNRIRNGQSIKDFVPSDVADYIHTHKLYV